MRAKPLERREYLRICRQANILPQQALTFVLGNIQPQPRTRMEQRILGNGQKVDVPVAQGSQPRVFKLLLPPQHREGGAVLRKQFLGQEPKRINVEQRSIGIKENAARGLAGCVAVHGGRVVVQWNLP